MTLAKHITRRNCVLLVVTFDSILQVNEEAASPSATVTWLDYLGKTDFGNSDSSDISWRYISMLNLPPGMHSNSSLLKTLYFLGKFGTAAH